MLKVSVVAVVLAAVPALSFAQCSKGYHEDMANVCEEGFQWDLEQQACVEIVTG